MNSPALRGLLYSQVGYEPRFPVRVLVRCTDRNFLTDRAACRLEADGMKPLETPFDYWGALWGSHWWVAEFPPGIPEGTYTVSAMDDGEVLLEGDGLRVQNSILWDETVFHMSVEMLESRAVMAKAKCGWMDAGCMWQESNAQSSMIIGLLDVLEFGSEWLDVNTIKRIRNQVINGCTYLVKTQDRARELGYPEGAMSHDTIGHDEVILPNDAFKAVVALRRASRLLPTTGESFNRVADKALDWLTHEARPLGDQGLSRIQRGLAADVPIPSDEWPTRDLIMLCWAALETVKAGQPEAEKLCVETARAIMNRQISAADPEGVFFGHFWEFDSLKTSEKSWTHSITGVFGADAGGTFPNYLIPFTEMLQLWPEHEDSKDWKTTLEQFAEGYLLPVCRMNPFRLIPQGIYGREGALWFAGPWHGMNVIYGLTAGLCVELFHCLGNPELLDIAYANLQWVAGLNAGLTKASMDLGCVIYRTDIADDEALPVSMIHRVGNRTAGTWFGTRGVVCNGFATGEQFKFDVEPTAANDGPHSLTDEDWIPHSAGWLSGLVRLQNTLAGGVKP